MKHTLLTMACLVGIASTTSANAADGTISFTGEITSTTCLVTSGSQNMNVALPTIQPGAFAGSAGSTAAHTRFVIQLTGCSPGQQARAFFEADADSIDYVNNMLKNQTAATTGGATGVGFALLEESSGQRINLGLSNQQTQWKSMDTAMELPYEVAYVKPAAAAPTAGVVTGSVLFSVDYQ